MVALVSIKDQCKTEIEITKCSDNLKEVPMLFYWIWPFLLALVPIAFRIKRLRFALLWIVIAYVVSTICLAIIPPFLMMMKTGTSDPVWIAGHISESLTTSMLLVVFDVPLALLIFWGFKKLKTKAQ